MLLGVSRCPGRRWLLVDSGCRAGRVAPGTQPGLMWPGGREKGPGAAAFGAVPQLLSPVAVQHTRDEVLGWHSGLSPRASPAAGCWDIRKGHRLHPARSCRAALSPARLGRVGLHSVSHRQHSPAAWAAPSAVGWREKRLSHPSVPTLEPCLSSSHFSVLHVCKVRGWGWPGAQSTATPEAVP